MSMSLEACKDHMIQLAVTNTLQVYFKENQLTHFKTALKSRLKKVFYQS
jgi:hypothetical protein